MRKILGLVLALVMILTAVSAFADIPSKTSADLVTVNSSGGAVVEATSNESPAVVELLRTLINDKKAIPEEAKKALPKGTNVTEAKDAVTLKLKQGAAEANELTISLELTSSFVVNENEEKEITALIGVLEDGKITKWFSATAIAKAGGKIDLKLSSELQEQLVGKEFIVLFAE